LAEREIKREAPYNTQCMFPLGKTPHRDRVTLGILKMAAGEV